MLNGNFIVSHQSIFGITECVKPFVASDQVVQVSDILTELMSVELFVYTFQNKLKDFIIIQYAVSCVPVARIFHICPVYREFVKGCVS